ncbi:hypothetical protein PSC71_07070 [Devosia sp. J2-20]|jgi:hypothetical protein|uniref:Uncharacterized protein n=1 Tax=Devosia litorisediminis TaxID=2829817 RepID=A0A942I758_9HYPH|nr:MULTISPECIES: hypothetical protein [Devosia]MBS3849743.1 hypothetical protein [Devosia litorisediminis]MCZ4346786.1 hypothetical protein [Devosia neptuniae]WDR00513.1 hypothetical protein PSC71_07070 [Devosia sp. J2-20]|tara:strand:+ start:760 stop:1056 length:297 start_codon:yes stop_codon:yes gene_type:complete
MTQFDFQAPAALFLGSDWHVAAAQGSRKFRTAAQALCFALEEAAPVSLKGASLEVNGKRYSNHEMIWLHRSPDYPLPRKKLQKLSRARSRASAIKEPT